MEKKIKSQAMHYGFGAILLAIVLGAFCYSFGVSIPGSSLLAPPIPASSSSLLSTFTSYEALKNFLTANSRYQGYYLYEYGARSFGMWSSTTDINSPTVQHSTTNIQVAGVDEVDIVKNDGEYIYVVSGNVVSILKAYPPKNAGVVSRIAFDASSYLFGIFVNGDRLAVLGCKYSGPSIDYRYFGYYYTDAKTFIHVYDISNRANPVLLRDLSLTGNYFNSRMKGEHVYFVVSQSAYVVYDTLILPKFHSNDQERVIAPSEIHYRNGSDDYYQFTTLVAMNMQNTTEAPTYLTVMMGSSSSMYVSLNNMYVTYPDASGNTSIYRVRIQANNMTWEANGKVLGYVLNQFSMDEYNGNFRIATATWINGTARNNLYVLDMNLSTVGKVEDIAPGETLDSARFIEQRCYLSTSVVRRDPFFVIDVENATEPKILGYLKIPGFTRYLHPYDADHIIGIGKDGDNVKISLFDVRNVSAPNNMSEYKFKAVWSDTPVLTEHKAFLFDYANDLLAIPISGNFQNYPDQSFTAWQGLYVFNITLSEGIVQKGTITHQVVQQELNMTGDGYYVTRSLYIEDVLYTVSEKKIKMNSLDDLELINMVSLP